MTHQGTKCLCTERLILRRLDASDAKSLYEAGVLGENQEDAADILHTMIRYYNDPATYHWGLEYQGKVVGRIKVNEISPRDHYMQLAYDIGPAYRNLGLMTEAVREVIRFLFTEVGVHRIYGQCRIHNVASARVMQKAGMVHEGRLRRHFLEEDGTYSDVDIYGVIQDDLAAK